MEKEQLDQRVTELEIRLSHQEAILDELTSNSLRQQKLLDRMANELDYIKNLLKEAAPSVVCSPDEETPPPHY